MSNNPIPPLFHQGHVHVISPPSTYAIVASCFESLNICINRCVSSNGKFCPISWVLDVLVSSQWALLSYSIKRLVIDTNHSLGVSQTHVQKATLWGQFWKVSDMLIPMNESNKPGEDSLSLFQRETQIATGPKLIHFQSKKKITWPG